MILRLRMSRPQIIIWEECIYSQTLTYLLCLFQIDNTVLSYQDRSKIFVEKGIVDFVFATSGEQALDYLNSNEHEAVLILSDINMPGMSGLKLLEHIKHKFLAPPPVVMMITAYGDPENYAEAMKLGADDFLTKPVDFILLKEKLKIPHNG